MTDVLLIVFSAVLFAALFAMMAISIINTKDICQLDKRTKGQFNKLFPMLLTFAVDVLKAKETIMVSVFNKSLSYNVVYFHKALTIKPNGNY